jgi:dipeptide transport system ATP-binding protein
MTVVLEGRNLTRTYDVTRGLFAKPSVVKALAGVSFQLEAGKTLAVVGESGSGKSTLARLVTLIEPPTEGELFIDGNNVTAATADEKQALRKRIQMVFQNPYGSLNPRQRIGAALEEPLRVHTKMSAAERTEAARAMMTRVGLRPEFYDRYPHMFSGGQRQRIAIARALMLRPPILVLDEPVSALDVSIRAQVLNLLAELQEEFGTAYLFISHDLSVVRHIADRVLVMYLGRSAELGPRDTIFKAPRHPYTRALLSATPSADPNAKTRKDRIILQGELPSPFNPPPGCAFNPRCPNVIDRCRIERPEMAGTTAHTVSCWRA